MRASAQGLEGLPRPGSVQPVAGKALERWLAGEFRSTRCRAMTGPSFSSLADVERCVQGDRAARCETIAGRVAEEARAILEREGR